MKKTIEKGSEEFQLWQDMFKFRSEYHDYEDGNFIEKMVCAADEYINKYKGNEIEEFAREMFVTMITDVDRRITNERKAKIQDI